MNMGMLEEGKKKNSKGEKKVGDAHIIGIERGEGHPVIQLCISKLTMLGSSGMCRQLG